MTIILNTWKIASSWLGGGIARASQFIVVMCALLLLNSCSGWKKASVAENQWSQAQKKMIMSEDGSGPMRVWKTNLSSDSLLLRKKSAYINITPGDSVLSRLSQRLYATVRDSLSLGVGIAAPQIGILKQMIWVQRFDKEGFPFEVYLNPIIIQYSDKKQSCTEGCLSIPDKKGDSGKRAFSIVIRYQDLDGKEYEETVEDFTAVIFQHEIDHLNGVLFTDYL